jgi:hypothetical protein
MERAQKHALKRRAMARSRHCLRDNAIAGFYRVSTCRPELLTLPSSRDRGEPEARNITIVPIDLQHVPRHTRPRKYLFSAARRETGPRYALRMLRRA